MLHQGGLRRRSAAINERAGFVAAEIHFYGNSAVIQETGDFFETLPMNGLPIVESIFKIRVLLTVSGVVIGVLANSMHRLHPVGHDLAHGNSNTTHQYVPSRAILIYRKGCIVLPTLAPPGSNQRIHSGACPTHAPLQQQLPSRAIRLTIDLSRLQLRNLLYLVFEPQLKRRHITGRPALWPPSPEQAELHRQRR